MILAGENFTDPPEYKKERTQVLKNGTNILGLIVFCTCFGIICGQLGEEGKSSSI